ncbi:MAG: LysR substrate-binding domain-containing protein [Sedimenticola sp.]|uniref:LysR family transcriptional regulator n=1 Tax=Sedimenticola thiotaurini TaxID=1543721 RepID=A0A558D0I8_9GAMM|nr:LysR substrate-binding domain-containing protein [Sedimenticola sp.]TVT54526.1 MAG: LysR family transcriptional regulator [Sedimenticola thiotaurini]MCW8880963.1 LysR substrate-binding domain-containing protein [Sedimenticola sp.]MCW8947285.1 LysR substrate-binding domain-containing protein [Sedimenticola sp.]MCW8975013.1 LysR substrate-binding domain-containing protein [Sedimenticola sp.]
MNFTVRQLKVFEAVATHLSFTRAADELYLSQPAVSMQIKQLEENVGLPLFEKLGKKIHLTEAGRELHTYGKAIFRQLEEMEEVMEAQKGLSRGRLDIAVASTVNYFAPRALGAFSRHYPGVRLSLSVNNRKELMRMLEQNEKDLVLMGQPPEVLDLEFEEFMDNPLVVIAPPDHPLVGKPAIPLKKLAQETFLMREPGSGTRLALERFFQEKELELICGMEMNGGEAIKQAVRAGLGLAVVSAHTIELELETQRLVTLDVAGFPLLKKWFMVHRRGKRLSPSAKAFHDFLLGDGLDEIKKIR